jgi:negative regulator of sigma E activity
MYTHTSDKRTAKKLWEQLGGSIEAVRRTGEVRFLHPSFDNSIRVNHRRKDVPAIVLSRINQLLKANETSGAKTRG